MFKIRVKENHWYPRFIGVTGITIYPYVLLADTAQEAIDCHILNHEFIHVRQVRQLGWIRFYATYLWKYAVNLIKYKNPNTAYLNISYEADDYVHQETTPIDDIAYIVS